VSGPGATPAMSTIGALGAAPRYRVPRPLTILISGPTPAPYRYPGCTLVRLISVFAPTPPLICIIALALAACAPIEQRPPPEPRIEYRTVEVDRPVPCFTEAERPVLPPPTVVDIDNATTDQLAAALAADLENERLFSAAVDALFIRCTKGAPQ
jgi:hypothetical protein